MSGRLSATFHLTHKCNLRCRYCFTGDKSLGDMNLRTADRAVEFVVAQARERGADDLDLTFFGGEPLLRVDLIRRIHDRVRARWPADRCQFSCSTNGTLLDRELLAEFARRGIYLSLSLDGDPATQDAQRVDAGGGGSWARIEAIIDPYLQWFPTGNVTMVVTPDTAARLDAGVRFLFARGFAYLSPTLDYGAAWTSDDIYALEGAYRRLADWYEERTVAGDRFYLSCFDERIATHARGPVHAHERCEMGRRQFSIAPSGNLYPCIQFVKEDDLAEWCIGDLERGFDRAARGGIVSCAEGPRPECDGCAIRPRCSTWCSCINFVSTGRVDRASPVACAHEQMLIPLVDDLATRLYRRRDPHFLHKHYNPAFPVLSMAEELIVEEGPRV